SPKSPPPDLGEGFSSMATAGVAQVIRWTLALLLALALVGVLILVVRTVMRFSGGSKGKPSVTGPVEAVQVALIETVEHDEVPDLPSGSLLESARRALDEGRANDAVLLARGASLRGLAEQGHLRLHRARTDREYVRSLRKMGAQQSVLRVVLRAVERVRWGGSKLDARSAKEAVDAASKLLVGGLALVLLMSWSPSARAQSDYKPAGSAALESVFEQHGFSVNWRLRSVREINDDVDVLVLNTVKVGMAEEDWSALHRWVSAGGVLFVAGPVELEGIGELQYRSGAIWMSRSARQSGLAMPVFFEGSQHCFVQPAGHVWIARGDDDCAVVQAMSLGEGGILAVSEHDILFNGSFLVRSNVDFVGGALLVGEDLGLWVFDEEQPKLELATIAGQSSESPIGSLLNARMLPLVGQLMFLLVVVALWRGWPFARLRDPPQAGRQDFADHVRALGQRQFGVGASRHAARSLAELALLRGGASKLHAVAVRAGHSALQATEFVARLEALVEEPDGPDTPNDIELMEELWRITHSL
ncbi:MAG: hypothetical protein ACI9MC_001686, partial [Kiritimatiellia bacterium]